MRTRAALSGIFASATILIIGWQAGNAVIHSQAASTTPTSTSTSTATSSTATSSGTSSATAPAAAATPTATPSASSTASSSSTVKDGTYTGSSVDTRYGSVQVRVTISGAKITDVTALKLTDDGGRSVQISNQAAPILRSEVLKSQSAQVSSVSGATYTTDAYLTSVQSALDQAGM